MLLPSCSHDSMEWNSLFKCIKIQRMQVSEEKMNEIFATCTLCKCICLETRTFA